jgi:hypothetical protein
MEVHGYCRVYLVIQMGGMCSTHEANEKRLYARDSEFLGVHLETKIKVVALLN